MLLVPILFRRLLALHDVDPEALRPQLSGEVRTRTWPSTSTTRRILEALPDRFPRFKGVVVDGMLRVTAMRLTRDVEFEAPARIARMTMRWPDLPDSVVGAAVGRPLDEFVGHPAVDGDTIITAVEEKAPDGERRLALLLDHPRVELSRAVEVRGEVVAASLAPDVARLIARTHDAAHRADRMAQGELVDPRTWQRTLRAPCDQIVGLRIEPSPTDGGPLITVRFPYDRARATAMGRSGIGAWFDRDAYAWRVLPGPGVEDGLSRFLHEEAAVVIDADGGLHIHR